jgi:hypothetical protein
MSPFSICSRFAHATGSKVSWRYHPRRHARQTPDAGRDREVEGARAAAGVPVGTCAREEEAERRERGACGEPEPDHAEGRRQEEAVGDVLRIPRSEEVDSAHVALKVLDGKGHEEVDLMQRQRAEVREEGLICKAPIAVDGEGEAARRAPRRIPSHRKEKTAWDDLGNPVGRRRRRHVIEGAGR